MPAMAPPPPPAAGAEAVATERLPDRAAADTGVGAKDEGATIDPSEMAATPEMALTETVGVAAMAPTWAAARGMTVRKGSSAIQAAIPSDQCSRPSETFSRARTTSGSNWVPLLRANSSRASVAFMGRL